MSPFTPLGDTLHDKKTSVEETEVLEISTNVFEEMFGKELAMQSKPLFLKNRTLTVSCASTASAEKIRETQAEIVDKINEKLGKQEVDRIRYLA